MCVCVWTSIDDVYLNWDFNCNAHKLDSDENFLVLKAKSTQVVSYDLNRYNNAEIERTTVYLL